MAIKRDTYELLLTGLVSSSKAPGHCTPLVWVSTYAQETNEMVKIHTNVRPFDSDY